MLQHACSIFDVYFHISGMTKIKMSKEEAGSADFVEKRRASLERLVYLNELMSPQSSYETVWYKVQRFLKALSVGKFHYLLSTKDRCSGYCGGESSCILGKLKIKIDVTIGREYKQSHFPTNFECCIIIAFQVFEQDS